MYKKINWQLPIAYREKNIASMLSWDGQIYAICKECGLESRIDASVVSNSGSLYVLPCLECRGENSELVRHLQYRANLCSDCGFEYETMNTGFSEQECPNCGSVNATTLSSSITPPFPARFGQVIPQHRIWGEDCYDDLKYLIEEQKFLNAFPDFPLYLLLSARFCQRLREYGNYDNLEDIGQIQNVEANFYRDYFRQTGEVPAGLTAIELFEECVDMRDDPLWKLTVEHNVAMAVYSVLAKNPEDLITALAHRPFLRREGIEAGKRALAILNQEDQQQNSFNISDFASQASANEIQRARLHHIIGDLLKVGDSSEEELKEAVEYLNLAINSRALDPRLERGARGSRAVAVGTMKNSSPLDQQQAIKDLEDDINADETTRAWTEKYESLQNLARIYWQTGEIKKALSLVEKSAALSLNEIEKIQDLDILQQKGRSYIKTFEMLATLYVRLDKPQKALDAIETLRAQTLRLSLLTDDEKAVFLKKVSKVMLEGMFEQMFGGKPSHTQVKKLQLETISPNLKKIRQEVSDIQTAFVNFILVEDTVTALIITPQAGFFNHGIISHQWRLDESALEYLVTYFQLVLDATPLREARLKKVCRTGYRNFLEPIIPILRQHQIKRVGIIAPGPLSVFPFEAFNTIDETGASRSFVDEFEVFYLPSLTLGTDLIQPRREHNDARLLAIGYLDEDLPETSVELEYLKETWGNRMKFLEGTKYSKKEVLEALKGEFDYIHFSGHGTFDILDPLDSALHLIARPYIDSHRITARNILNIRFKRSPVITMSACSSSLTAFSTVNDCTGLTGSFLKAGARAVIGSRWDVYDDASAAFMKRLYNKILNSNSSAQACFYETQNEEKQAKKGVEDWAAFGYLGLP